MPNYILVTVMLVTTQLIMTKESPAQSEKAMSPKDAPDQKYSYNDLLMHLNVGKAITLNKDGELVVRENVEGVQEQNSPLSPVHNPRDLPSNENPNLLGGPDSFLLPMLKFQFSPDSQSDKDPVWGLVPIRKWPFGPDDCLRPLDNDPLDRSRPQLSLVGRSEFETLIPRSQVLDDLWDLYLECGGKANRTDLDKMIDKQGKDQYAVYLELVTRTMRKRGVAASRAGEQPAPSVAK